LALLDSCLLFNSVSFSYGLRRRNNTPQRTHGCTLTHGATVQMQWHRDTSGDMRIDADVSFGNVIIFIAHLLYIICSICNKCIGALWIGA
jgi:hypothetical protein